MENLSYAKEEQQKAGMKVVLEFPQESESKDDIRQEVKGILSSALQDYLERKI